MGIAFINFMNNPSVKTFNNFIDNISELNQYNKLNKQKLNNICECLENKHLSLDNSLKIKKNRKGPLISASCFPSDIYLPVENKLWITKKSGKSNVWKLEGDYDFKQTYLKSRLTSFQFNKKTLEKNFKIKKIVSNLNTKGGKLAIGEIVMNIEKVNTDYSIWYIEGTLIAAPCGTSKETILNGKWKYVGYAVDVDGGVFGFHNGSMFNIMKSEKAFKKLNAYREYFDISMSQFKKNKYNWAEIYGKDLDKLKNNKLTEWVDGDKNKLFGFYHNNGVGDGSFDVYKSNDMFLILNPVVLNLINRLINIDNNIVY